MASKYTFRGVADMSQHDKAIKKSATEVFKYQHQVELADKELQKFKKESKTAAGAFDSMSKSMKQGNLQGMLVSANGALNQFGGNLGRVGTLIDGLSMKSSALATGVGAAAVAAGAAAKAWADYNSELAKQDQITTVTTGLKGSDADNMTNTVRAMADTYNVDFRNAINAANTLMQQFGTSADETLQLMKDGMQGMIVGDGEKLLQMIQSYAPAFRDAGINASQLVAIIHNSEGGIFTDDNMNAIVQGIKNIRTMTNGTAEALKTVGVDADEMTKKLNDGTMTIFEVLQQVSKAIQGTSSSSQAAGEVMQAVFGKKGVTAGQNLGKAIAELNTNLEETKRQTGEVGEAYAELQTANENLNKAIRDCFAYDGWEQMAIGIKSKLLTALADVLKVLNKIDKALKAFITGGTMDEILKPFSATDALNKKVQDNVRQRASNMIQGLSFGGGGSTSANAPSAPKPKGSKSGGGKGGSSQIQYAVDSVGWLENRIQELQKQIKLQVNADEIARLQKEIDKTKEKLELLTNPQTINIKEIKPLTQVQTPSFNTEIGTKPLFNPADFYKGTVGKMNDVLDAYDMGIIGEDKAKELIDGFNNQLENAGLKPIQVTIETDTEKMLSSMSDAIGSIGGMFEDLGQSMQLPELNIMGTIAQAIANVIAGFAEAQKSPANTVGGIFTWLPSVIAGMATVGTVIAQIHNLSGYANGGVISGAHNIGDMNLARVNNGEMILNQRQQSHLFNLLDNNRPSNNLTVNGEWKLKGQDLYLSMKNYGKGQSKLGKNIGII